VFFIVPGASGECNIFSDENAEVESIKKDRVLESFLVVRETPVTHDEIPSPALSPATRKLFKKRRTIIVIPLISSHRLLGYIGLGQKASGMGYNAEDLTIFRVLANQLVIAINNARLYLESLERQRLEEELALARRIQQQLLPATFPSSEKLQFTAFSEPSREVGGDYYDFINTPSGGLALGIGDASGKGIPASLLIARVQAILHSVVRANIDVNAKIHHINNVLAVSGMPESYVTFFYGEIDYKNFSFRYCNAGHNYPVLFRENGDYQLLHEGGLILGAFGSASYESGLTQLNPGDLLVCYTDGITEAMDTHDCEFGEERLKELLFNHRRIPLPELRRIVWENIQNHCHGRPIEDDCTMLMMRVY
jgi:sigma-B regulation protein RsbU (phosphoserine phosphatase)